MGKRADKAGSVTKKIDKKNGKEYVSWRARWTDPEGNVKEKRFKSEADAQQYLTKTLGEIQSGSYIEPNNTTLEVWLNEWLENFTTDLKYQAKKSYESSIRVHIIPKLGKIKLEELRKDHIQIWVNTLSKSGKKVVTKDAEGNKKISYTKLAPKSVKNHYIALKAALAEAVEMKLIKENPADGVKLPRVEKKEKKYLSKTQLNDFMKAAKNDDLYYALAVLPLCGLREGELLGLTWDCVDFDKNRLHVNKQQIKRRISDGGYTLDSTKSDHSRRDVQLAPQAMKLLEDRAVQQFEEKAKAGDVWRGFSNEEERRIALVFTNAQGGNLNPKVLWRHCKKVLRSIGIENMTVHDLRHSFAVLSLEAGDDIKMISGNLGHYSASFTMDTYGHISEAMMNDSAARMQALLDSLKVINE